MNPHLLIVGAGSGLSASLSRVFSAAGYHVSLAARDTEKLNGVRDELDALCFKCDATSSDEVNSLFQSLEESGRSPDVMIYNAGYYTRGAINELQPEEVQQSLAANAYGAFLCAHQASKRMISQQRGVMLFTGASAGMKGFANSAPFAMGKFALRGLCQSLSRELGPQNIHVVHAVLDGLIFSKERGAPYDNPDKTMMPEAIAKAYLAMAQQERSAWTYEIELRPWIESF